METNFDGIKPTILIVEDEPFIRFDLVEFFEVAGFDVYEAADAHAAILRLTAGPSIEIVLTDVNMPGSMDGLGLAHFIRERFPRTLILIASGAVRLQPADMPVDATFFHKPYDARAVLRTIRSALPSG